MHLSQRPTAVIGGNRSPSVFPSVLCASCLRTLSFLSSRHISPTERSRRFELPCRGVYLLRRSLSDSVVSPGSSYLYPLELTSAPPSALQRTLPFPSCRRLPLLLPSVLSSMPPWPTIPNLLAQTSPKPPLLPLF